MLLHAALVVSACSNDTHVERRPPVTLTLAVPQGNQAGTSLGMNSLVQTLAEEGLTALERDGRFVPKLAERWTVSDDGLAWTFRLRQPLHFHDGSAVSTLDVKKALDSAASDVEQRRSYPALGDIRSIEVLSDREIVIHLHRPSRLLLDSLSVAIVKTDGQEQPVGTGPFKRIRASATEVEMEAHDQYNPRPPQIDRLTLKAYPLRLAWASMMRGEVDFVSEIADDARDLIASDMVDVRGFRRSFFFGMALNSANKLLKPTLVRHALNLAIDRRDIMRVAMRGRGEPAWTLLSPLHWAHDATVQEYPFDQKRAIEELERAGHVMQPGDAHRPPARLRFTCLIQPNYALTEKLAKAIQRQLLEVGVDMRIQVAGKLGERLRNGDFDAVVMDINGGPSLSRPYSLWRTPAPDSPGFNSFGYSNAAVDAALDAARYARTDEQFRSAIARFERLTHDDPPVLFLAWNERSRAMNRRFQIPAGFEGDPLVALPLLTLRGSIAAATTEQ